MQAHFLLVEIIPSESSIQKISVSIDYITSDLNC